jgi:hypothetical protein
MTHRMCAVVIVILSLLASAVPAVSAQDAAPPAAGDRYLGVWSGSWDGAGSGGGFELTLQHEKDKPLAGKVSVTGEPSYAAALASVTFDGAKMTAKYDFTPEPSAEVVLTATFEGDTATGSWSLREKASGNEVASGGWKVKRADKK